MLLHSFAFARSATVFNNRSLAALLVAFAVSAGAALGDGPLTYNLHNDGAGWPEDARSRIDNAMAEAVALYNEHGYFEKHVTANYNPGVPTAHANYDGWIEFGSNSGFQNTRTALHEIAHTLGVGTHGGWNENRDGNTWTGEHAVRQLGHFDGTGAVLSADAQHFWPYGLNQNSEDGEINRIRHIRIVAAMRRDMGIVGEINGLPADWHRFHFSGLRIRAGDDTDGDGFTNIEEYEADTDPTDPLSFPGAPELAHRWLLNETAETARFASLHPGFDPARDRALTALVAASTGSDARFEKGDDPADPPPVYGGPAVRGTRVAEDSTASLGTGSPAARMALGNVVAGPRPFSVSLWFLRYPDAAPEEFPSAGHIVSASEGEEGYWDLYAAPADGDTYNLGFRHHSLDEGSAGGPVVAGGLRNNRWYHVVLARDEAGVMSVNLDGEAVFSAAVEPAATSFLGSADAGDGAGGTVAYWRFEEGPAGAGVPVEDNAVADASGNGNHLRTWSTDTAPAYVADTPFDTVPATGEPNGFALDFSGGNRDVYSGGQAINSRAFEELTVEASFKANVTDAWQVIVGKDGNPIGGQPPFSLKIRNDGLLEAAIADGGGTRRQLVGREPLEAGVWYSAAATVTDSEMTLWLKGPEDEDYLLENTMRVDGIFAPLDSLWSVGRGQWGGGNADFFNGLIDEVRISDRVGAASRVWLGQNARSGSGNAFRGRFDDVRIYRGAMRNRDVEHLTGSRSGIDYASWADDHFEGDEADRAEISGPEARPAGDNLPNLLRYALGLAPAEAAATRIGSPELRDGRLELVYERDPAAVEARVLVEFSRDLETWHPADEAVSTGGGTDTVTVRAPYWLGPDDRQQFLRMRVFGE